MDVVVIVEDMEIDGYTYSTDLYGSTVRIYADNKFVGKGTWVNGRIEDCDAVISDTAYTALDRAIRSTIKFQAV